MPIAAEAMEANSLSRLHRAAVDHPASIRALLQRVREESVPLASGIDGQINRRRAEIVEVLPDRLVLRAHHLESDRVPQFYFQFDLGGSRYFFAADVLANRPDGAVEVAIPPTIHEVERRSLPRQKPGAGASVELALNGRRVVGSLVDRSYEGAAIACREEVHCSIGSRVDLTFGAGGKREAAFGVIRNASRSRGWQRIGVSVSQVPYTTPIPIESRTKILQSNLARRTRKSVRFYTSALGMAAGRLARALGVDSENGKVEILTYSNQLGQPMVAIVDRVGDRKGGTAVIVAPAWGRTKETMLPLAAVICQTFASAGEPVAVIRFDGTNRRGESWIDPECRDPGSEYLHFRFSQAVEDIHSTIRAVTQHAELQPRKVILVTASLASIEGRKAVAMDSNGPIAGWVSLVGMVDLHSGLRAASGGVDYAFGLERGVRFGRHELAGVVADMDLTGRDVLEHHLGLFEDARRDMAAIKVPVTWIHGRHDGWIEIDRVQELMSAGDGRDRRLIEVPTGHQLRSSRQALETFQLVAEEVSRIALGRALEPAVPNGRWLEAKQRAERVRRPKIPTDLKAFWRRYVLGKNGRLGIEILAATRAYRDLMAKQIVELRLRSGFQVADLGAGAGDFGAALMRLEGVPRIDVTAVDFIPDALRRASSRIEGSQVLLACVIADLDSGIIPLVDQSFDAVLASLLLSYVARPERLLAEAQRILRPGGRLVVSCPRRDADLSKIYVEGIRDLDPGRVRQLFGTTAEKEFAALQRDLLNEGARLLSLEEEGWFRFWDLDELTCFVEQAGFVDVHSEWAFGNPPQVTVVSATRK